MQMRRIVTLIGLLLAFNLVPSSADAQWKGKWITCFDNQNAANTWMAFRKTVELDNIPTEAVARIAVDSKYWLWINGEPVVREGGLKRGPTPLDTYYDEVDLAPYLHPGDNTVAVMVCYFGKDGFSHISSGKGAMLFDCPDAGIFSDQSWKSKMLWAYGTAGPPHPNFRLSESNILFDARRDSGGWFMPEVDDKGWRSSNEFGKAGCYPWNELVKRPVPLWKDFGLKAYSGVETRGDTVVCTLPYNCQFTTYMKVDAPAGRHITVLTDNNTHFTGGDPGLRSEYITRDGEQEYENPLWVNGHKVYYIVPAGVEVIDVKFRESGYDCEFSGEFQCSDPFFNELWEKSRRSLYITMRDNFMDCPDRERAQWAGDAVNESLEAYYCLSPSSHLLVRKWLAETTAWQREDGKMWAPVPSGNWFEELPCQVLATIGYYGTWYYYLYTGDRSLIPEVYPRIQKYLDLWEEDETGVMKFRTGDWTWGDWGDNRDMVLIYNLWYYIAVQGMYNMALEMGYAAHAGRYAEFMERFRESFNRRFWNGTAYRHPDYADRTDDRVQAMAVISGIAGKDKYPAILKVLQAEEHASPYMEKYVFEAMMLMGYEKEAMVRHRKRFGPMVEDTRFTTLFEGWGIGEEGFGGGTVNHGWSGGGLAVLGQYMCGVLPVKPGFTKFSVLPRPGDIDRASVLVPTVSGDIAVSYSIEGKRFSMSVTVPEGTTAVIGVPDRYRNVSVDGEQLYKGGKPVSENLSIPSEQPSSHRTFEAGAGTYIVTAI